MYQQLSDQCLLLVYNCGNNILKYLVVYIKVLPLHIIFPWFCDIAPYSILLFRLNPGASVTKQTVL